MIPEVTVPSGAGIRVPVEVKLKPRYRYDPQKRILESDTGVPFKPSGDLPRNTRIVSKAPSLSGADPARLSKAERDLQRYIQVILPEGEAAADYVDVIRRWPGVEDAWVAPQPSLPGKL